MRLENLYSNFGNASSEEQAKYVAEYRLKRAEDMALEPTWPKIKRKTKSRTKNKNLSLSEDEKSLMKLLEIKKKEIIQMRTLQK
jgi:hypothetical protein